MKTKWLSLALFAAAVLLYIPALPNAFVYDDVWMILKNPALSPVFPIARFFLDGSTVAAASSGIAGDVYRPLATLSFAVSRALFGENAFGFRFVGLLLHAANGVLLFQILRRWTPPVAALLGALLFVVHPVQVESVAWIAQRSVLICAFWSLVTLWLWNLSEENPTYLYLSFLTYGMALLGKETALALPLVALVWPALERRPKLPTLALNAIVALAYFFLRRHAVGHLVQPTNADASLPSRLFDGMTALSHYAKTVFFPIDLNVSVRAPEAAHWLAPAFLTGAALFLFLWAGTAALMAFNRRLAAAGFVMVLAFLAPHFGFVPMVTFAADRFLYLPMAGIAVMAAAGLGISRVRWAALPFLVILAVLTTVRIRDWKDETALWQSSVGVDPRNSFAQACYGQALEREGDDAGAEQAYKQALSNRPTVPLARDVLGILIRMSERRGDADARRIYEEKLATVPQ